MVESIITQRQSQTHEVEGGNNSEQRTAIVPFFCHAIIVSRLGFLNKKMKYDLLVNYSYSTILIFITNNTHN